MNYRISEKAKFSVHDLSQYLEISTESPKVCIFMYGYDFSCIVFNEYKQKKNITFT